MKPMQSVTLTEIEISYFLLLIIIGCCDGHDIKAAFYQADQSIDDKAAYTKCLGECAKVVGCSGVSMGSNGQCHPVYGVSSGSTPITVLEVNHA